MAFILKEAIEAFEDTDDFVFSVKSGDRDVDVKFYDDSGLDARGCDVFFLAGFEYGPTILIHARSFEAAWETWIDESPTIPESELPEAYGITDDREFRAAFAVIKGPCPNHWERDAWDAWHAAYHDACMAELQRRDEAARDGKGEHPELVEGYEYQSNASGTGIVDVGHYAWMNEIDAAEVTVRRKEA